MMIAIPKAEIKPRLHGLDYLRGLAALGIMIYHYSSWTFGEQPASSFLGKIGIYGVAVFYILSGQTLGYVYGSRLQFKKDDLYDFYKKRFFRIFPLLWLATLASIILSKHVPNITNLFLNLTGLFGLVKWNTYFATGAWSIGNELTFYLAFPLVVFLLDKGKSGFILAGGATITAFGYFAFYEIHPNVPLADQWHAYTNPLNQFLFFGGGVLLGKFISPNSAIGGRGLLFGLLGLVFFLIIPVQGNAVELVTGLTRIALSACCFLVCYGFFSTAQVAATLDKPLALLGQASYSLYLLHPLVYAIVKAVSSIATKRGNPVPTTLLFLSATIISLIASYISYKYFERFFVTFSHRHSRTQPVT